ncbi:MAG: hypothetical protein HRU19_00100 [Pseudobacteriovorax sp.]|nr:hypothetical protein [Pseudobacteriovorax sp.]
MSQSLEVTVNRSIEESYRTEYGRLLAVLTKVFGTQNFPLAEDVLQQAFSKALSTWCKQGMPQNPQAWIMTTAKNGAVDAIRKYRTKVSFASELSYFLESEWSLSSTIDAQFSNDNIRDEQLRMFFLVCHDDISPENRLPFLLKNICGFRITAISRALLIPEATVKKRLQRAKAKLQGIDLIWPKSHEMVTRMDSVHTMIYLLFNEGFHSTDDKSPTKKELCQEAIGLAQHLTEEPRACNSDTLGLLALMNCHFARFDSKVHPEGSYIPLDQQDRRSWDQKLISNASKFIDLAKGIPKGVNGRYLIEASIAHEHCKAVSFEQTNWNQIVTLYQELVALTESPVAELNMAIAIGYQGDHEKAIQLAEKAVSHKALANSFVSYASLAHLYAITKESDKAKALAAEAAKRPATAQEIISMQKQIDRILKQS